MRNLELLLRGLSMLGFLLLGALRFLGRIFLNTALKKCEARESIIARSVVEVLEMLGPTYIKLGQILSTRRDLLSAPTIAHFEHLQDRLSPMPFKTVSREFWRELRIEINDVFAEFDTVPIASASIASVYRAKLLDGRAVAVKIRRPGVIKTIDLDLILLRSLVNIIEHFSWYQSVPIRATMDEFCVCLRQQVDFRHEADANTRLSKALACMPEIWIPTLVKSLCSSSVLTMEYIGKLSRHTQLVKVQERKALVTTLHALYRMIFVEGYIHCDLHPGNLFFLPDGRVALLDFGFVVELKRTERLRFAEFFYAIATNDGVRCAQVILETASFVPSNLRHEAFEADIVDLVARASRTTTYEFLIASFVLRIFDLQRRYKIRGTPSFMMSILALLMVEGIAKEKHPELDFQQEAIPFIIRAFLRPYRHL